MSDDRSEFDRVTNLVGNEIDVLKYEIKYLRQSIDSLFRVIHGTENDKLMNDLKNLSEKLRNEEEV